MSLASRMPRRRPDPEAAVRLIATEIRRDPVIVEGIGRGDASRCRASA